MMKRYTFLASFAFLLPTLGVAQTITDNESPIDGDSFIDNYAAYMAPGPGGSGQTWDFSMLTSDSTRTVSFQTPASTGYDSGFPNATIAETTGVGDYTFFESSSAGYDLQGVYLTSLMQEIVYQDPERVLAFPCMLNTNWTDDFSSSFTSVGFPVTRTGSVTGMADGSGTLIMPYGTVNNVLRIMTNEVYTDATIVNINYDFTTYFYYKPGVRHPLMMVFDQSITTFGNTTTNQFIIWMQQGPQSVAELTGNNVHFDVFPNPATDVATVEYGSVGEALDLELIDLAGRVVHQERIGILPLGMYRHELDVQELPAGVYQVRMTTANGDQGVRRLVVQ
ncbi:MAG: T9SS type A sorting domain-containing protein [Flavobacteriales bacterium]|nr:T9SS type A sorting domain-containing protein [Flavobacteriales bacterium]